MNENEGEHSGGIEREGEQNEWRKKGNKERNGERRITEGRNEREW